MKMTSKQPFANCSLTAWNGSCLTSWFWPTCTVLVSPFVTPLCRTVLIDWLQYPSAERTGNSANENRHDLVRHCWTMSNYVKLMDSTRSFGAQDVHRCCWWLLQAHATGSKNLQQSRWYVWWFLGSPVSRDLRRWSAPRQRCHNTIPKKKHIMK